MKITMNRTLMLLTAATSISLASSALYAEPLSMKTKTQTERDYDGNYVTKTSVEGEDSQGTSTSETSEVKVKVNQDGSYSKVTEEESTKDPKGLMNKTVVKSTTEVKSNKAEYEDKNSKQTKNGLTGTKTNKESSLEIKSDSEGNVEQTTKTESSTDPKGLMNKSITKTSDKIEKNDGKGKYHYVKEVNGKTIEDKTIESK